jgi:dipeptide/tripeptide permease
MATEAAATPAAPPEALTWKFPRWFWWANVTELFERAAFYGLFIAVALFLTDVVGFTDIEAGYISAGFSAGIYLLPFISGALADRFGFRASLAFAFAALAVGYTLIGLFPTKLFVPFALGLVCIGGSFVKPIVTGTVSLSSNATTRARAFSIFYMLVNIGSFTGKTFAKPVRVDVGLGFIPIYSGVIAGLGLCLVILFYRPPASNGAMAKSIKENLEGFKTVLRNGRFMALILITAGFWIIQGQMYASMPKYVLRMVGEGSSPEWYANVNPAVVVLCVVTITQIVKKWRPVNSILVAMLLIPFSAVIMAISGSFAGNGGTVLGLHPVAFTMIIGIALQGFAECFLSPRYLEYASKQAPAGQEGLYMGYSNLNTFVAWLTGFIASGYLLDSFCPDPKKLPVEVQTAHAAALKGLGPMPEQYAHANYLWLTFAAVGFFALLMLLVFRATEKKEAAPVSS